MQTSDSDTALTYRDAGVDIEAGNSLVDRIKPAVKSTHRQGLLGGIGGFGGLFEMPTHKADGTPYTAPVMVSGTDGVGTKLRLAIDSNRHESIGIDLVAMCVNDIVVSGAEPLFFLDYFASGHLDVDRGTTIIEGIAEGCRQAGAALVGGETAEMPGMYHGDDYDLAGFAVGIVDKPDIIDPASVKPGDAIIGLASSGPHSNGFSLIRAILDKASQSLSQSLPQLMDTPLTTGTASQTLIDALMAPTRIYVKSLLAARQEGLHIKALAHITGGGLTENIPRVLAAGLQAQIDSQSWQQPAVFHWLQQQGNVTTEEMHRVFNCGIGMAVIVDQDVADTALNLFNGLGETATLIGRIAGADGNAAGPIIIR